MNIHRMIAELQSEKERLDEAIVALERLSAGKPKRRAKLPPSAVKLEDEPAQPEATPLKAHGHS